MLRVAAVTAVRSRFMNAVFFFKDESRDLFTWKTSIVWSQNIAGGTFLG